MYILINNHTLTNYKYHIFKHKSTITMIMPNMIVSIIVKSHCK